MPPRTHRRIGSRPLGNTTGIPFGDRLPPGSIHDSPGRGVFSSGLLDSPAAMPIYEYRCENGHLFEVMQKITEDPVTECGECGAAVQRVFHPIAVHFKGSG